MRHRSVVTRSSDSRRHNLSSVRAFAHWATLLLIWGLLALTPTRAVAQVLSGQGQDIVVGQGKSTVLTVPNLQRLALGDPEIAEAVAVSPREILINGKKVGTTSLVIWDQAGNRTLYNIRVTTELTGLQQQLSTLFPNERVTVSVAGGVIMLTGRVSNAAVARQMVDVAKTGGATVLDNLVVSAPRQVLLQVRFAEVTRSALKTLSADLTGQNLDQLDRIVDWSAETVSDGLLHIFLSNDQAHLEAVIHALKTHSLLRSLAEPNLVALDGQSASFLAGGEFPYPYVQPGAGGFNAVTIQFRDFGIKLDFTPTITSGGTIRMHVEPEVSSLDFANGLTISGFTIPALITRRAKTDVELREGQTFAIAGLLNNSILNSVTKIPVLGDLPVLGALFRSQDARQNRTELLVLVTPHLVAPSDTLPPVPTGEPREWKWDRFMGPPPAVPGGAQR